MSESKAKNNGKNKIKKVVLLAFVLLSAIYVLIMSTSVYEADFCYDDEGYHDGISYKDNIYVEWSDVSYDYEATGVIDKPDMSPYDFVGSSSRDKIYISDGFIENLLPAHYFSFCEEGDDFIYYRPDDSSLNILYVKKGFVFPDVYSNEIEAVWMSLDKNDTSNITDEAKVKEVVECIKNQELELNKEIYDYILANSWDNCHFNLKYKGYPVTEEFYITKTEDNRYVIRQENSSGN